MRVNLPGSFTYLITAMRCHPLTQTLSPSGGEGDQDGRPSPLTQKNLPQKAPVGERKQTKGGMYASVRLFLQSSLSGSRARPCWGVTLGLLLCVSSSAAPGAVGKKSPSQEVRQRDGAQARASITVADGRLSVNLSQADLRKVLRRIGQEAGFSLMMASTAGETISVQFTDMALIQGLRRLLRLASLSYAMVYDANVDTRGGLKELWVFGAGRGGASDLPRVVADQEEVDAPAPKRSLLDALASLQPPDAPPLEPATSPQPIPFLDALRGQQPEVATPPQPIPFLDALRGQPSEPATPPQQNPFLSRTPGQRQP